MGFIEGAFLQLQPTVLRLELAVVVIFSTSMSYDQRSSRSGHFLIPILDTLIGLSASDPSHNLNPTTSNESQSLKKSCCTVLQLRRVNNLRHACGCGHVQHPRRYRLPLCQKYPIVRVSCGHEMSRGPHGVTDKPLPFLLRSRVRWTSPWSVRRVD